MIFGVPPILTIIYAVMIPNKLRAILATSYRLHMVEHPFAPKQNMTKILINRMEFNGRFTFSCFWDNLGFEGFDPRLQYLSMENPSKNVYRSSLLPSGTLLLHTFRFHLMPVLWRIGCLILRLMKREEKVRKWKPFVAQAFWIAMYSWTSNVSPSLAFAQAPKKRLAEPWVPGHSSGKGRWEDSHFVHGFGPPCLSTIQLRAWPLHVCYGLDPHFCWLNPHFSWA